MADSRSLTAGRTRAARQAGWTVWETVLGINIVGLAVIAFLGVFSSMQDARYDAYANQGAKEALRNNLAAIAHVLRNADMSTLDGFDDMGRSSSLNFRSNAFDDGEADLRKTARLEWRPARDTAPGIKAPGEVVHVRDGLVHVVAKRVPEGTFIVSWDASMLVVELSTYDTYEDRTQLVRGSTSVLIHD